MSSEPEQPPPPGRVVDARLRFESCRRAVATEDGGGRTAFAPYRRCPGGVIADVDCPEFASVRCHHHLDRAGAPPTIVAVPEVEAMSSELAVDFLTPRYRRRLRALVATEPRACEPGDESPLERGALARATLLRTSAVVNVPADRIASDRVNVSSTSERSVRPGAERASASDSR